MQQNKTTLHCETDSCLDLTQPFTHDTLQWLLREHVVTLGVIAAYVVIKLLLRVIGRLVLGAEQCSSTADVSARVWDPVCLLHNLVSIAVGLYTVVTWDGGGHHRRLLLKPAAAATADTCIGLSKPQAFTILLQAAHCNVFRSPAPADATRATSDVWCWALARHRTSFSQPGHSRQRAVGPRCDRRSRSRSYKLGIFSPRHRPPRRTHCYEGTQVTAHSRPYLSSATPLTSHHTPGRTTGSRHVVAPARLSPWRFTSVARQRGACLPDERLLNGDGRGTTRLVADACATAQALPW